MSNPIQNMVSEVSKIASRIRDVNEAINTSANQEINKVLNNTLVNSNRLAKVKQENELRINEINTEYIRATQDVLNDKALDFLIMHSKIDAPTLTSIFAGFELAKASRADKLNEQRGLKTESLRALSDITQQEFDNQRRVNEQTVGLINDRRGDQLTQERFIAGQQIDATERDIGRQEDRFDTLEQRAVQDRRRSEDAELSRDLQEMRSSNRRGSNESLNFLKTLQQPGGTQPTGTQPGVTQSGTQPVGTQPVGTQPGVTQPVGTQPVGTQQVVEGVNPDYVLTPTDRQLLNYYKTELLREDPENILLQSDLVDGATAANLTNQEQVILNTALQSGGSEVVIDYLNRNEGLNIGDEVNNTPDNAPEGVRPLTTTQSQLVNLYRQRNRYEDDPPAELATTVDDLKDDEFVLLDTLEEQGLTGGQLSDDTFNTIVDLRAERFGEQRPLYTRNFEELSERDQTAIMTNVLENALSTDTTTVTNESSPEDQLMFNEQVVERINSLNERQDVEVINPLELQQRLIEQGVDIENLPPEEFEKIVEEEGL